MGDHSDIQCVASFFTFRVEGSFNINDRKQRRLFLPHGSNGGRLASSGRVWGLALLSFCFLHLRIGAQATALPPEVSHVYSRTYIHITYMCIRTYIYITRTHTHTDIYIYTHMIFYDMVTCICVYIAILHACMQDT